MWKLAAGVIAVVAISLVAFAFPSNFTTTQAGNFDDGSGGICNGSANPVFNPGNDPDAYGGQWVLNVSFGDAQDGVRPITIDGPPPLPGFEDQVSPLSVVGSYNEATHQVDATGDVLYFFDATVNASGTLINNQLNLVYQIRGSPDPPPNIDFQVQCDLSPPAGIFSITVLKLNDATNGAIPGWGMDIFANGDCSGNSIDSGVTDDDGIIDFIGLSEGVYSVLEQDDPGFVPDGGNLCREDISVPGASDPAVLPQGASQFVDCPIPDLEFPDPGCDEFNSGAQLNIEFVTGGDNFTVTLSGPTTVVRSTAPQDVTAFPAEESANPWASVPTVWMRSRLRSSSSISPALRFSVRSLCESRLFWIRSVSLKSRPTTIRERWTSQRIASLISSPRSTLWASALCTTLILFA